MFPSPCLECNLKNHTRSALVPTLAVASCITRLLYKKTGNVWTAAFFNTILMTMMTVANTTIYFQR